MSSIQFTADLSSLQGNIISLDFECSFKALSEKGGNEKKINFVIDKVRSFLKSGNFINDVDIVKGAEDTMRLFALYIVLNSDLTVLNELVSTDSSVDNLIWTLPTIPKYLMSEMLWNLCMEKFVKEIITYSHPHLAIEVADALIMYMKYMDPTHCLKPLYILSTGCFNFLCRIHFFDNEENLLKSAFNNFQTCVAYFCNPPNKCKLEKLKKDATYKYYGDCLYTMLTIVFDCFTQYSVKQTWNLAGSDAVYEVMYNQKGLKKASYKPNECTEKTVVETLNKCLTDLLDKCMTLVMGINIDIFCSWSEFKQCGVSMQESIGHLSYKVQQQLLSSKWDHAVVNMLEQISRKPVNIKEIINESDSSVVLEKIKQDHIDNIQWLQALAHRNNLFEDSTILQILDINLDKLNEDNCYEFFQKFYKCDSICNDNKEFIQILRIKFFQRCNKDMKYDIVDLHFKDGYFNNVMECTSFANMLTEFFNKLAISKNSDLTDVLNVFIQNPKEVYLTILKTCTENKHQTNLMLKVITHLSKYSNHCYNNETESCLVISLKTALDNEEINTDAKQNNLTDFISKLKYNDIIPASKLLLFIIMPKLHAALVNSNYRNIHLQCKLLQKCFSTEELLEYRAPMLAMLGQVMGRVRWKVNTFDILAPAVLNLAIDLQTSLLKSYSGSIPEKEVFWLKRKLKDLDPLNMYYYRQLWNPPGKSFVEVVSGVHIHKDMDAELLTLWLAQVLSSSTLLEWICIWDSLEVFEKTKILDLFHKAVMSVLTAEKCNRTNRTWACLLYSYKNLFHCIRYKFLEEPPANSQVKNVTNKLLEIIGDIHDDYAEEFGAIVMPLFGYIAERKGDHMFDISKSLEFKLQKSKLNTMINNLFCNSSS